jgi:hypothetical protein
MFFWKKEKKEKITQGALGLTLKEKRPTTPVMPDKGSKVKSVSEPNWLKSWHTKF